MLANNEYPVLDGVSPSWADVIMKASAPGVPVLEMKWIKAINTGASVEVGEQKAGGRVMKTTSGSSKHEASITIYREGWNIWLRNIEPIAPKRGNQVIYSLVHFGVQVQHTPPGSIEIFEYRLKGCRIIGRTLNGSEGNDPDVVELPLHIKEVVDVIDGKEYVIL
jgi:hypothetical protein